MDWKSANCEVCGRGHTKTLTPCQDKTKRLFRNGIYAVALADGAGSEKLSHFGAECVVDVITDYITEHFDELYETEDGMQAAQTVLRELLEALKSTSENLGCSLKNLASTLLMAAVSKDRYMVIHIGDGVIGYLDDMGLKVASAPDNGEFANVTTFVTSPEALTSMRLFKGSINSICGFVLMSDGTEQSLYHKQTKTLAGAVKKLMHRTCLIDKESMHVQLRRTLSEVIAKNTQDDCSIAILSRPSDVLKPFGSMSYIERKKLFGVHDESRRARKRVARYDAIINELATMQTPAQIARKLHLKPKHTKRHLRKLVDIGLVTGSGGYYSGSGVR